MRIGLALSGGGIRATVFHMGMLGCLAHAKLFKEVSFISTVSGGSLCAGLVYVDSAYRWPDDDHYLNTVVPSVRHKLTRYDFQGQFTRRIITRPFSLFRSRADFISSLIRELWGITGSLKDLPDPSDWSQPRWMINAMGFETGKNWRFSPKRMGDYIFGYVDRPDFPISDAMTSSAAVPGLIGPLIFEPKKYQNWYQYVTTEDGKRVKEPITPELDRLHLWDGGVYDNAGIEPLTNYDFSPGTGYTYRSGVDFVLISDASGWPGRDNWGPFWKFPMRIVRLANLAREQVRSLRKRSFIAHLRNDHYEQQPGRYVQIGTNPRDLFEDAGWDSAKADAMVKKYLTREEARAQGQVATTLRQLSEAEFDALYRHGYETTALVLHLFGPDQFTLLDYKPAW